MRTLFEHTSFAVGGSQNPPLPLWKSIEVFHTEPVHFDRAALMHQLILSSIFMLGVLLWIALAPKTAMGDPTTPPGKSRQLVHINDARMEPVSLDVTPGTTVLWKNDGPQPVRVRFGRPVVTLCDDPKSFDFATHGTKQSDALRGGDFASLCFLEENDYPFKVEQQLEGATWSEVPGLSGTVHVERRAHEATP